MSIKAHLVSIRICVLYQNTPVPLTRIELLIVTVRNPHEGVSSCTRAETSGVTWFEA